MEKHGVPHHFPCSKLNEAFKVDISLSNITRKRVCERNKLHPPSYPSFLKTTLQQIVPPLLLLIFHPFRARKLPGNNSKPCPSVPPPPASLNHLQIDYLNPPPPAPRFLRAKWLIFQGFTRKSNIAATPGSRELRHDDDSDINKSQRHGGSPLSGRARKLEELQGKTSFNTEEKSFRTYRV